MWDWNTYFIFGFSLVWAVFFLSEYSRKPGKWSIIVISFLPLFFLFAFRAETVGTDLPHYAIHVEDGGWFLNDSGGFPLEILSQLLYFLSHKWGGFHTFLFLSSLIEFMFLCLAAYELNKRRVGLGMTIAVMVSMVVLRSVSMIRNGIAIASALCAVAQLLDNEKSSRWKYWFYSIIALGFHNSAILMVPIFFICRPMDPSSSKYKKGLTLRIIVMVVMFALLYYIGASGFLDLFFQITGETYNERHFEANNSWGLGNLIIRLPFLIFVILSIPNMKRCGFNYMPLLMMLLFDVLVSQTKYVSQDFERLTMYTRLSVIVLWGVLYKTYAWNKQSIARVLFFIVGVYYYTYNMYVYAITGSNGQGNGLMPYQTWLDFFYSI